MIRIMVRGGRYIVEREDDDKTITELASFNTAAEAKAFLEALESESQTETD